MQPRKLITSVVFLLLLLTPVSLSAQSKAEWVEGEFLVKANDAAISKLKKDFPEFAEYSNKEITQALTSLVGGTPVSHVPLAGAKKVVLDSGDTPDPEMSINLIDLGLIDYIEPNYLYTANLVPNDPSYNSLWGMHQSNDVDIDAPEAWELTTGSSSVIVGVVDSGVNHNHPDLAANMWVNTGEIPNNGIDDDNNGYIDDIHGWSGITDSGTTSATNDDNAHGTHCAGTIGGVGNNGQGVAGVAWTVKIMALKFLNSSGSGSTADAIDVINYAVQQKTLHDQGQGGANITVLSNSWGGGGYSSALAAAIQAADDVGIFFPAAAGNDSLNNDSTPQYPANYTAENVLSVAAIDSAGSLASFSNYGATTVDVAAPGVGIYSSVLGTGYSSFNGTSMATPHVAGIAALIQSAYPGLEVAQVRQRILSSVKTTSALSGKVQTGGYVKAAAALFGGANFGPTFDAVADQTVSLSSDNFTVPLTITDPEGDPITVTVEFPSDNETYYSLYQQWGPFPDQAPGFNKWGLSEKNLYNTASTEFMLMTDGTLYEVTGYVAPNIYVNLIGTYGAELYNDPSLFTQAGQPMNPMPAYSANSTQFQMDTPDSELSFNVKLTATAIGGSASRTFQVTTVQQRPPTIATIADQSFQGNPGTVNIPLTIDDPDNDPLTITTTVTGDDYLAWTLKGQYNLRSPNGGVYYNSRNYLEKYVIGDGNDGILWFFILPDGGFYQFNTSIQNSQYLGNIGRQFYTDPNLLFNMSGPSGTAPATASVANDTLTLTLNSTFAGTFSVDVTVDDGTDTASTSFFVAVNNSKPAIQGIADYRMRPYQNSILVPVSASDPDGDTVTLTTNIRTPGSLAYYLDQQYDFVSTGDYNTRGALEKYFTGIEGKWFFILPDGGLYLFNTTIGDSKLLAKLGTGYYDAPSSLVDVNAPSSTVDATAAIEGDNVRVDRGQNLQDGVFYVTVTASDNNDSDETSFAVIVGDDSPPTLAEIPDQSVSASSASHLFTLSGSDADGDPLTYGATVAAEGQQAYDLDQTYNLDDSFVSTQNYFYDVRKAREKYLEGAQGEWIVLMPDGRVLLFNTTLEDSTLVARLPVDYYNNPALLVDAPVPGGTTRATTAINGNQLTVTPESGFTGVLSITASVTDGGTPVTEHFYLTVSNTTPVISVVPDQQVGFGETNKVIDLTITDPDVGQSVTLDTRVLRPGELEYILDQDYSFSQASGDPRNTRGENEAYMVGPGGRWYFLLPDGGLYLFNTSIADSTLLATVDTAHHADLSGLYNAAAPAGTPDGNAALNGSQLTVSPNGGFTGSFYVEVTATDGYETAKSYFKVTRDVNRAPVIQSVGNQSITTGDANLVLDLNVSDPDGDSVSISASVRGKWYTAYQIDQMYNLIATPYSNTRSWLDNEKYYVGRRNGSYYWLYILPNGNLYRWVSDSNPALNEYLGQVPTDCHTDLSNCVDLSAPQSDVANATASMNGSQLTVTPNAGFAGTVTVDITADDGNITTTETFDLTVTNSAPVLNSIADQSMLSSDGSMQLTLSATDSDGAGGLQYSAAVVADGGLAYDLNQEHQFYQPRGGWYTNARGASEKYLLGIINGSRAWFYLLPNGALYHHGGGPLSDATFLGNVGSSFHTDPSTLVSPSAPGGLTSGSTDVTGTTLTITPNEGFTGTFYVTASVTDGVATDTETFAVSVSDNDPSGQRYLNGATDSDESDNPCDPDESNLDEETGTDSYSVWIRQRKLKRSIKVINREGSDAALTVYAYRADGSMAAELSYTVPANGSITIRHRKLNRLIGELGALHFRSESALEIQNILRMKSRRAKRRSIVQQRSTNSIDGRSYIAFGAKRKRQKLRALTVTNLELTTREFHIKLFDTDGNLTTESIQSMGGYRTILIDLPDAAGYADVRSTEDTSEHFTSVLTLGKNALHLVNGMSETTERVKLLIEALKRMQSAVVYLSNPGKQLMKVKLSSSSSEGRIVQVEPGKTIAVNIGDLIAAGNSEEITVTKTTEGKIVARGAILGENSEKSLNQY